MSSLGLDLGTTGVRAAAYDETGRQLASAAAPTPVLRPARGRAVFDAEAVLVTAEESITRVAAACAAVGDPVAAIAYCSQGETIVPVDRQGRALDLMPVGMDRRGVSAAEQISERIGADRVQAITGAPLHPMFAIYKLAVNDPGWRGPEVAAYRSLPDFLFCRWGSAPAIDWTVAARYGLMDVDSLCWSSEILAAAGELAPWLRAASLSEPVTPGTVLGKLDAAAASRLELSPETVLVAGLHDQAAAFLGAGGAIGAHSVFSLGSSDCLLIETPDRIGEISGTGLATYPWRPGRWLTLAGTAAGGWALDWLAAMTGFADAAGLVAELAAAPPDLVVLPYLAGSGTLDNDPEARGMIFGLTLGVSRAELTRAFVEAAGYELAAIVAALEAVGVSVPDIRAAGTGADDRNTLAVRADASGRSLTPTDGRAAVRGAALLAAQATGRLDPDAPMPTPLGPALRPVEANQSWYAGQRQRYRELYRSTRHLNHRSLDDRTT